EFDDAVLQALLLRRDVAVERREAAVRVVPVDVAHGDEVLGREVDEIAASLSADADGGDVERIARRGHAAAEDTAWNDRQAGTADRRVLQQFASRNRHTISYSLRKATIGSTRAAVRAGT